MDNFLPMGYTEMYEWGDIPLERYGLFVQFDFDEPSKITPAHSRRLSNHHHVIGVSTIASGAITDNPDFWYMSYVLDECGGMALERERLAVGVKQYDQNKEMPFIKTMPWEHHIRIPSEIFDEHKNYVPRSHRNEWTKVTVIGKCIVRDDGTCTPGEYCTPYFGPDKSKWGHAIPSDDSGYFVLDRFSPNTIIIFFK